jgi:hypothetical protein
VQAARAQPASQLGGNAGLPTILLALQKSAGIDMVQVSYRDFAPAYRTSTRGGSTSRPPACRPLPLIKQARPSSCSSPIATARRRRRMSRPQPGQHAELTFEGTVGLYGWRGMPASLKERIAADLNAVTADPAFRARNRRRNSAAKRYAHSVRRGNRNSAARSQRSISERKATGTVNVTLAGRAISVPAISGP